MKQLHKLFESKQYLAWYVKDKGKMSIESMLEHILNYGDWEDFQKAEKALGTRQLRSHFSHLIKQKRVNLRLQTINYFTNYFYKYA